MAKRNDVSIRFHSWKSQAGCKKKKKKDGRKDYRFTLPETIQVQKDRNILSPYRTAVLIEIWWTC